MLKSPSRRASLATLEAASLDHGMTAAGVEYAPDELEAEIHRKRQRRADREVRARVRDLEAWDGVFTPLLPPVPGFWARLNMELARGAP